MEKHRDEDYVNRIINNCKKELICDLIYQEIGFYSTQLDCDLILKFFIDEDRAEAETIIKELIEKLKEVRDDEIYIDETRYEYSQKLFNLRMII